MAFFDTLVATIQNNLAGVRGLVPRMVLLFGKDSAGEPKAIGVASDGSALVSPAPGTPGALGALADGGSLSAVPVTYKRISVTVGTGAAGWVQIHNSAGVPADGSVCLEEYYASGPCTVEFDDVSFANGAYWCMSSTARIKTITATTLCCAGVRS